MLVRSPTFEITVPSGPIEFGRVALDARQQEPRGAVNRAIAALRGVGKRDNPLDPGILFADQPHCHAEGAALGIARQVIAEGQAVQFEETVPPGCLPPVP